MPDRRYGLLWVARTPNRKTGDMPSAYVGETVAECRDSCAGCALLDRLCYAWKGLANVSLHRLEARRQQRPGHYTVEHALAHRARTARAVRIGAMGDPARANRWELRQAAKGCRARGLVVLSYTHFWREAPDLKDLCLASTDGPAEAAEAIDAGWVATTILPWDHDEACGPTFTTPNGRYRGFVCPAQTKADVTCNDCRMCSPQHPVWQAGKVHMVGFLDHSRAAAREKQRMQRGRQLPLFRRAVDTRVKVTN